MEKFIALVIILLTSCVKYEPQTVIENYEYNLKYTIEYVTPKSVDFVISTNCENVDYIYKSNSGRFELIIYGYYENIYTVIFDVQASSKFSNISLNRIK